MWEEAFVFGVAANHTWCGAGIVGNVDAHRIRVIGHRDGSENKTIASGLVARFYT